MIGETISHYKIIKKIGAGGMGEVYLAEDTKLKREIALKFLSSHLTVDKKAQERFKREAQAAAAQSHPNIVTIYEIDEFDGQVFIAMEYVKGVSLRKKTKDSPILFESIVDIAIQICEGLGKAHQAGIMHRDIKPDNILINNDGRVKILDFGLAKLKGIGQLTKETTTLGTIQYMSPEQACGEDVDQSTDIWSFGAMLYEIITGKPPFRGEYEQAMIYSILNEEPERITNICPDIPLEFEEIITKCLSKAIPDRYKSVNELICDLQNIKDDSTTPKISSKKEKRSKDLRVILQFIVPLFLVLFTLLVVTGYFIFNNKKTEESKLQFVAVLPFVNIRNDTETDFLSFALATQIIGDLTYIKSVSVRPSSSIRKYIKQNVDASTAGKELLVDYVLTGHYLKETDIIRMDVELINVQTNEIIWSEPIEVRYENAFKLQDIVSEKVINSLKIQFSADERQLIQTDVPQNPLAYEYFLRSLSYPLSNEGHSLAIEMLKKSIQLDSTFAPAFVELGQRINGYAIYYLQGVEGLIKAEQYYLKALSLNSESLCALSNLAGLYNSIGRKEKAMELVRKALEINPNDTWSLFNLSKIYRYTGMLNESEKEADKVLRIDPHNPSFRSMVLTYIYLGKFNKAFEAAEIDRGSAYELTMKGTTLLQDGRSDEAMKYFTQVLKIENIGAMGIFATGYKSYIEGNKERGLQIIGLWEQSNPYDAENLYFLASIYGLFNNKAGCIRILRKAIDSGFFNYPFMLRDPYLDSVRNDPEFQQVLTIAKEKHEVFKEKYFSGKK